MPTGRKLIEKFILNHTTKAVQLVEANGADDITALVESISATCAAMLLGSMDTFSAAKSLEKVDQGKVIEIFDVLPTSISRLLVNQIDENKRSAILDGITAEKSKSLQQLLRYPPNTVGAHLEPVVFTLRDDLTVEVALERVRKSHPQAQSTTFILSQDHTLTGFIELKDLIATEEEKSIDTILKTDFPKILADMDINILQEARLWNGPFVALPVVDIENLFLGVITKEAMSRAIPKEWRDDRRAVQASSALGDLYQIGFFSLFRNIDEIKTKPKNE